MKNLEQASSKLKAEGIEYQFFYESLSDGLSFKSGCAGPMPLASCYKVALLGAILEKLDSELDLRQEIVVTKDDFAPLASGVLNQFSLPMSLNIETLLRLMMVYSDGAATDVLQRTVTSEYLNDYLNRSAPNSKITHNISGLIGRIVDEANAQSKYVDRESYRKAILKHTIHEDYTTGSDMVSLLKYVYSSGELARRFLMIEPANPRLAAYNTDRVKILGKTGTLGFFTSMNDSGFIVKDGEPVAVFALLTLGWKKPRYEIEHFFGEVGRILMSPFQDDSYTATYSNSCE